MLVLQFVSEGRLLWEVGGNIEEVAEEVELNLLRCCKEWGLQMVYKGMGHKTA